MVNIIHTIPENEPEAVEALSRCTVATVHEALGQIGALDCSLHPLERHMKACGRAITVKCHAADNLMLIKAVSMAQKGDVIVADTGDARNAGPFGEVLAVECLAKGVAGLVINGSVRDTEAIIRRGFPVWCTSINVRGTSKAALGTINHDLAVGGEIVHPGDYVLADADGVMIVPHDRIKEAAEKAEAREAKEAKVMERLQNGESLFDIYGYQSAFDRLGCSEEKTAEFSAV